MRSTRPIDTHHEPHGQASVNQGVAVTTSVETAEENSRRVNRTRSVFFFIAGTCCERTPVSFSIFLFETKKPTVGKKTLMRSYSTSETETP
jgi:hypothetical protein